MAFKTCVLLITFFLFENGQTFRLFNNSTEQLSEDTVRMINDFSIEKYPQEAIDKVVGVCNKASEENMKLSSEPFVLLVEGILYQMKMEKGIISDNSRHYDVASALKRIEETSVSDKACESTEKLLETIKNNFDKEFPSEVGQRMMDIVSKMMKAETFFEAAMDVLILSFDGATAVTSKPLPIVMPPVMERTTVN